MKWCCGLVAGWDRLHSEIVSDRTMSSCELVAGWDRLHSLFSVPGQTASCGLVAGWDRLHLCEANATTSNGYAELPPGLGLGIDIDEETSDSSVCQDSRDVTVA